MACAGEEEGRTHTHHHRLAPKVAVGRFSRGVIAVAEREGRLRLVLSAVKQTIKLISSSVMTAGERSIRIEQGEGLYAK